MQADSIAKRHTSAALMLAAFGLAGCRADAGQDCHRTECADGLTCHEWVCRPQDDVARILADKHLAKACRATCGLDGRCGARDGRCVVVSADDCRKILPCTQHGACGVKDGVCAAVTDDDCQRSEACTLRGRCHAAEGRCTLAKGACRALPVCKEQGLCTEDGDDCAARHDDGCEASEACWSRAECTARDGKCVVAADADCAMSYWCKQFANCRLGPGPGGCVRDAKRFVDSVACSRYGCCGPGPGSRCLARNDADCRASEVCKKEGKCFVRVGECVRGCQDTADCRIRGHCTNGSGTSCVAGSDADCASSLWCKQHGNCTAKGGECVVTNASCAALKACAEGGRCTAKGSDCVATRESCEKHEQCKKLGLCDAVDGWCRATKLEHCMRSELCDGGRSCRIDRGFCKPGTPLAP